ncbi:MAG: hypothetical protein WA162_04245 [Thermodesulfobacteriota bacterium]
MLTQSEAGLLTKARHFNILKRLMATKVRFVDIYSSFDEVDAKLIENILKERYISCKVSVADSFVGYDEVERRISVEEDEVDNAVGAIRNAIKRGMISEIGRFRA